MNISNYLRVWLSAIRPKTLGAAVSPILIGTTMAFGDGKGHALAALAALLGALLIQIGTNFSNDYFDYIKGADTEERLGPVRVIQSGQVRPKTMLWNFVMVFGLATLVGIYLVFRTESCNNNYRCNFKCLHIKGSAYCNRTKKN